MKNLPGHMRQRVKRTVDELAEDPRPSRSIALDVTDTDLSGFTVEPRRLRMGQWRIIYAIDEAARCIDVLAVRKRPPYDYEDLEQLLETLL